MAQSSWRLPVRAMDTTSTILPTGTGPIVIDGVPIQNKQRVLFTALTGTVGRDRDRDHDRDDDNGNHNDRDCITDMGSQTRTVPLAGMVFSAHNIGVSGGVKWTIETDGQNTNGAPADGDTVYIQQGMANHDKVYAYDGINAWINILSFRESDPLAIHIDNTNAPAVDINWNHMKLRQLADGVLSDDAATVGQLSGVVNGKVNKSGDTMSGALNMGSNKVTALASATAASDATNLGQVTSSIATAVAAKISKSGDTMSGALSMGGNQVNNLADGTASNDATTVSQVASSVNTSAATKVNKSGDTMSGALNMGSHQIHGLTDGSVSADAASVGQVTSAITTAVAASAATKVNKSGDTMSGALNMGSHQINGLSDGTTSTDAINLGQLNAAIANVPTETDPFSLHINGDNAMHSTVKYVSDNVGDFAEASKRPTNAYFHKIFADNDVSIAGNLTVSGTVTHVNSTELSVTDQTVTVNAGGTDGSAVGAGIEVARTSTPGSLVFDPATTSKWKAGLLGSETEVVTQANFNNYGDTRYLELNGSNTPSADLNLGNNKLTNVSDGTASNDATTVSQVASSVNTSAATKVNKSGDTMSGALNMGSNKVTNLADGTASTDAINLGQLTSGLATKVNKSGDTMSGALNMGSHQIHGLTDGSTNSDAATVGQVDAAIAAIPAETDPLSLHLNGNNAMQGSFKYASDNTYDFAEGAKRPANAYFKNLNANGDVVISGDLTVNGTTTNVNSTDLNVADQNITINSGGSDGSAMGAGLTVARTSTPGSLVFDSTVVSYWRAGIVGGEQEVITLANLSGRGSALFLRADGGNSATADLNLSGHKLTNVTDPTSAQDAATKSYVDTRLKLDGSNSMTGALTWASDGLENIGTPTSGRPNSGFFRHHIHVGTSPDYATPGFSTFGNGNNFVIIGGDDLNFFTMEFANANGTNNQIIGFRATAADIAAGQMFFFGNPTPTNLIKFDTFGNINWVADGSADIGTSGSNRPRSIFAKTSLDTAGTLNLSALSNANILWTTDASGDIGALTGNRPNNVYFKGTLFIGNQSLASSSIRNNGSIGTSMVFSAAGADHFWLNGTGIVMGSTKNILWTSDGNGNVGGATNNRPNNVYAKTLIDSSGTFNLSGTSGANILWTNDASGDFGALTGNRPNNVYFKGTLFISDQSAYSATIRANAANGMIFSANGADCFFAVTPGIVMNTTKSLLWNADGNASGNLGAPAANRPNHVYAKTGVHVNGNTASSCLEATSTTQGFLPPRMTTTQKNAIAAPAQGLVVFDTTLIKLCVYSGTAWQTVTSV